SAESAAGKYPVEAVEALVRTCIEAERSVEGRGEAPQDTLPFDRIDQTVAMATLYAAGHLNLKAIAALTNSGTSALWLSRYISGTPVYGFTRDLTTYRKMALFRHVQPVLMGADMVDRDAQITHVQTALLQAGVAAANDRIALTFGQPAGQGANTLRILEISAR
ncbi:pyruvate kinase alpha/beta domain-containing protein, partial [Jeongeupia chitinilytica]|uniref:pyruvate kinase alpha/beta domain-containing protein n=1 Tax=Jeongeupia chitinilytica TaxID=1041641 RepID=UPI0027E3E9F5